MVVGAAAGAAATATVAAAAATWMAAVSASEAARRPCLLLMLQHVLGGRLLLDPEVWNPMTMRSAASDASARRQATVAAAQAVIREAWKACVHMGGLGQWRRAQQ